MAWGKGYATEGARALIRKGFTELGARHVVATTYQDHLASRRVMVKAGMTLVRSYRMPPERLARFGAARDRFTRDNVEYAIERAAWAAGDPGRAACLEP